MRFEPKPPNDFEAFCGRYYETCRSRVPKIQAVAAKWAFEDLIPGLSDFDTRFILEDGMSVDDWCAMSTAVGEVHLDLCRRFPHWARNLEHLPGMNLTWSEVMDPKSYYPEYPQWTFYQSTEPDGLSALEAYLAARPWDEKDEYHHLGKFCLYYGRYDRQIDPPINLGPFESKYPLHSRFMHYFCPPMQSALSILLARPILGKMEAVRLAGDLFPEQAVFKEMQDAVERHYEVPELYEEPALTHLEDRLELALGFLRDRIAPHLTLVSGADKGSVADWKEALGAVSISPLLRAWGSARFARLMKGRLQFYAASPPHFDSTWCIEVELRRFRRFFFTVPFGVYWEVTAGEKLDDPAPILPRLHPEILDREELRCTREFVRLLPGHWNEGDQVKTALAVAAVFDGFFHALCKILQAIQDASS